MRKCFLLVKIHQSGIKQLSRLSVTPLLGHLSGPLCKHSCASGELSGSVCRGLAPQYL